MPLKQLDWRNPDDWGKSPLTDNALRMQQTKDETREQILADKETAKTQQKENPQA